MNFRKTKEVFTICQTEKISILLERDLVSQRYGFPKRYLYKRLKNQGS